MREPAPLEMALFALSRLRFSETNLAAFRATVARIQDWSGFADLVSTAHCAPIVLRNLEALGQDLIPSEEHAVLVAATRAAVIANMRNEAELRFLGMHLFAPERIECLLVKGVSIAHRYYPDPALRMHRDIDILLRDEDRMRTIEFGVSNGYRFFVSGREFPVRREADAIALYRFGREVSMVSPRLAVIELHKSIDKAMGIFPREDLFEVSEVCCMTGTELRVLPTNWLFCYLAYHGCQHNWSKLIWMVDLMVLLDADDFSWSETREIARSSGILSAVEGAYGAARRLAALEFSGSSLASGKEAEIIEAVLLSSRLGVPDETRAAASVRPQMSRAFWLGDGVKGLKFLLNRLIFLSSPGLDDYRLLPTESNRFWVLFLLRPMVLLFRRVREGSQGRARK